jgi:hypothetical protein
LAERGIGVISVIGESIVELRWEGEIIMGDYLIPAISSSLTTIPVSHLTKEQFALT